MMTREFFFLIEWKNLWNNPLNDPRTFNKSGEPIYLLNNRQRGDYWRNIVGQYCFWLNQKILIRVKNIRWTDDRIKYLFHERNKRLFLNLIDKEFEREIKSTKQLTEREYLQFTAMIFDMLRSKKIDIFEYGEV